MPGAEAAVRELESLGFVIAVISNGEHRTRTETVEALPFSSSIRAVISSEFAGVRKPSPSIFHRAAHDLGLVIGECLYVGDHPENDYWGAKNAGLHAVWLRGFHAWPLTLAPADRAISALHELPSLILSI
ncbi:hypothetical protein ASB57_03855 [Bordetella sp. N]|nr:hypothetical protein ASB57_03855 [Bordetella sp. N]